MQLLEQEILFIYSCDLDSPQNTNNQYHQCDYTEEREEGKTQMHNFN
jgi:hypothetical protein